MLIKIILNNVRLWERNSNANGDRDKLRTNIQQLQVTRRGHSIKKVENWPLPEQHEETIRYKSLAIYLISTNKVTWQWYSSIRALGRKVLPLRWNTLWENASFLIYEVSSLFNQFTLGSWIKLALPLWDSLSVKVVINSLKGVCFKTALMRFIECEGCHQQPWGRSRI